MKQLVSGPRHHTHHLWKLVLWEILPPSGSTGCPSGNSRVTLGIRPVRMTQHLREFPSEVHAVFSPVLSQVGMHVWWRVEFMHLGSSCCSGVAIHHDVAETGPSRRLLVTDKTPIFRLTSDMSVNLPEPPSLPWIPQVDSQVLAKRLSYS